MIYKTAVTIFVLLLFLIEAQFATSQPALDTLPSVTITKTEDFEITGEGTAENWEEAKWIYLSHRNDTGSNEQQTKAKILYSDTGLYVLFHNEDRLITTPFEADFEELWKGDVVEVFLWPHKSEPDYFEYEITPLDYELPLIVSNIDGELLSWIPFDNTYREGRKVRHKTTVRNGEKRNGASIDSWTAEFFIPYKLLYPLDNIYPAAGTTWRANFYRVDYDDEVTFWSWSPFEGNFHDYQNFGTLIFE